MSAKLDLAEKREALRAGILADRMNARDGRRVELYRTPDGRACFVIAGCQYGAGFLFDWRGEVRTWNTKAGAASFLRRWRDAEKRTSA